MRLWSFKRVKIKPGPVTERLSTLPEVLRYDLYHTTLFWYKKASYWTIVRKHVLTMFHSWRSSGGGAQSCVCALSKNGFSHHLSEEDAIITDVGWDVSTAQASPPNSVAMTFTISRLLQTHQWEVPRASSTHGNLSQLVVRIPREELGWSPTSSQYNAAYGGESFNIYFMHLYMKFI